MKCAVPGCKNSSGRDNIPGITFHVFPAEAGLRQAWVDALNKPGWKATKYSKLCSVHFEDSDFYRTSKMKKLHQGVIPKLFLSKKTKKIKAKIKSEHDSAETPESSSENETTENEKKIACDERRKRKIEEELKPSETLNDRTSKELKLKVARLKKIILKKDKKMCAVKQMNRRLNDKIATLEALLKERGTDSSEEKPQIITRKEIIITVKRV